MTGNVMIACGLLGLINLPALSPPRTELMISIRWHGVGRVVHPDPRTLAAGRRGQGAARPVTLVLLEDFTQPGLVAVVRRSPGSDGEDVIGMKRAAISPRLVTSALEALSRSRNRDGDTPSKKVFIYFRDGVKFPKITDAEQASAQRLIDQLLNASRRDMPGIGRVPAITVSTSEISG